MIGQALTRLYTLRHVSQRNNQRSRALQKDPQVDAGVPHREVRTSARP